MKELCEDCFANLKNCSEKIGRRKVEKCMALQFE